MPIRKTNGVKELSYYFEREEIVFKNEDAARRYFDKEDIFDDYDEVYKWRDYLANRFYYDEVFELTEDEKKQINEEYTEYVFELWVEDELFRCEIYDDEEENED